MRFSNREEAGRRLAQRLVGYTKEKPLVLGLPRGGVPVAYEVAEILGAPLDIWVVRKVGAPAFAELGVGAVAEGGIVYLNRQLIDEVGASEAEIQELVSRKLGEVQERVRLFRGGTAGPEVAGRTVILVDDGIATGGTVRAAIQSLRAAGAQRIILAVPVAASETLEELAPLVEDVVCVHPTSELYAIGAWYDDFQQVPDEEVKRLLRSAARGPRRSPPAARAQAGPSEVTLRTPDAELHGSLSLPLSPRGLVLFAHGSGSSRLSPRNRHVAALLQGYGLATLLFDLLTPDEEQVDEDTGELRFDIPFLARRLVEATDWALSTPTLRGLRIGYFGSSTGAAAALVAAAQRPEVVGAVVSRGGRPDLAWDSLPRVRAPTLLIVGGEDSMVVGLNEQAYARLAARRELVIVPGATHLFEEPGALDEVARLAGEWLTQHLSSAGAEVPLSPG